MQIRLFLNNIRKLMINPNNSKQFKIFGIIQNPNTFKLFKSDYYLEYFSDYNLIRNISEY